MKIKTIYRQWAILLRGGISMLALASLAGCTAADPLEQINADHTFSFSASIGDPNVEVVNTRGLNDGKTTIPGTYSSFKDGTAFGVYADKGFSTKMENLKVTKSGLVWKKDNENITWGNTTENTKLTAYYPHSDTPAAYPLTKSGSSNDGYTLEDVLVATRQNVSYGNPAIFITFTHRFALLRIKLGSGFDGFTGAVKATMEKEINTTAEITDGIIMLTDNTTATGAKTFLSPTKTGNEYYILVPADDAGRKVASLTLGKSVIDNTKENNKFNMPELSTKPNTLYTLTAHILDGVPVIRVEGIESWTDASYIGTIKAKPGIYSESELHDFSKIYNAETSTATSDLSSYGEWNKDGNGKWTIYLQANLYMTELDNMNTEEIEGAFKTPIVTNFTDLFEGQGYTINGLSISGSGFFGTLANGAKVNDLILTDISVANTATGATDATGLLVGTLNAGATLTNCHILGTSAVTGSEKTGGLVGESAGTINRSSSFASVTGTTFVGGLVGNATAGIISNSFAKGWVTAQGTNSTAGALTGNALPTTGLTISNSYATVSVNGAEQTIEYKELQKKN